MFLKALQKLTYVRKCKYGKYKIIKKIDKKIFSVVFKKDTSIKVLKKVSDFEYGLYCNYKKGFKKTNKARYGAKGVDKNQIKDVFYEDYDRKNMYPFYWSIVPKTNTNVELMFSGSFINEVCVNDILKTYVKHYKDFFCGYETAWKSKRQGNIILEYGGKPLEKVLEYLNLEDLKCIVFQVLVALSWGQRQVHLKHHDLHTENVFIQLLETTSLHSAVDTEYEVPVCEKGFTHPFALLKNEPVKVLKYKIPKRYHIRLADFGFSCATNPRTQRRTTRADYDLLETGTKKWGEFSETLYENEGYDMVYFLNSLKDEVTYQNRAWLKTVLNKINELNGKKVKVSTYCRPLDRCKVSPYDVLTSEIFNNWKVPSLAASLEEMD